MFHAAWLSIELALGSERVEVVPALLWVSAQPPATYVFPLRFIEFLGKPKQTLT